MHAGYMLYIRVPLVEISDRSSIDNDINLLRQLLNLEAVKPKVLMHDVPG